MFVERGAPDGLPVFGLHGTPGSRLVRNADPDLYERHGVRWIAYDRPGYGGSDPHVGRSVADAPADIGAIADELGLDRFAVVGASGGERPPVGAEGERVQDVGVARQRRAERAAAGVPEPDRLVGAGAGQGPPVGAEGHRGHEPGRATQRPCQGHPGSPPRTARSRGTSRHRGRTRPLAAAVRGRRPRSPPRK